MPQSFKVQEYQASAHIVETQKLDSLRNVMMETQQMGMDVAHHAQLSQNGHAHKTHKLYHPAFAITQMDGMQMEVVAAH